MWPTSPSPISATASSPISASRCLRSSLRADLSFIQTVHSGRLLSGFLNDANLIRQTASRSIVTLGENYLKVIILVATMFYMDARFAVHDPAVHAVRLVPARAPAPQDAEIDHEVAAGDRRSLGAHHPDLARHARGARLSPGAQGRSARRLHHQPRARIHHARHARPRAVEPVGRAPDRTWLCARHLFRRHQGHARRPHARPVHGLHDLGAPDLRPAQERRDAADAACRKALRRQAACSASSTARRSSSKPPTRSRSS